MSLFWQYLTFIVQVAKSRVKNLQLVEQLYNTVYAAVYYSASAYKSKTITIYIIYISLHVHTRKYNI